MIGLWNIKDQVYNAVRDALVWLLETVKQIGLDILSVIFTSLDVVGVPDAYLAQIQVYTNEINYFFPLSEIVAMATALFALYIAVKVARWGIKLIPTLG